MNVSGAHLFEEVKMPANKILGRGTKKGIARIRWKPAEVVHATFLFLLMLLLSVGLAAWFELHHFD
jgi:hypothetical protein